MKQEDTQLFTRSGRDSRTSTGNVKITPLPLNPVRTGLQSKVCTHDLLIIFAFNCTSLNYFQHKLKLNIIEAYTVSFCKQ